MNPVAQQIAGLVRAGQTIEAIKLLRRHAALGLKEAKDLLDADASATAIDLALQRHARAPAAANASEEIQRLVAGGEVIAAIKLLREQTGIGLQEAKEEIDRLRPPRPPSKPLPWKALAWIGAAAALALAAWLFDLPLI